MNTTLSPFIFAQDSGKNLIIDTENLIVAQIITSPNTYWKDLTIIIPDYTIGIVYLSTLNSKQHSVDDKLLSLNKMKDFFIAEKLLKNEKYYSRHKNKNGYEVTFTVIDEEKNIKDNE